MEKFLKTIFFASSILIMSNSSCTKEEIEGANFVSLNKNFELALNEKAVVEKKLVINLTNIADSRCPLDVQCVWAGNVTVGLTVSDFNSNKQEINLCKGDCSSTNLNDSAIVNIDNSKYTVILKEVNPLPKTKNSAEKKVTVLVTKN